MKTTKQTFMALLIVKQKVEAELFQIESQMRSIFLSDLMQTALDKADLFGNPTAELVYFLQDRDFPLTRAEINQVLTESGFQFNTEDVEACRPDADLATNEYRAEQAADYASVFGYSND